MLERQTCNLTIFEPRQRLVSAAPFRDRVVHHALCQVIEPIWECRFIDTSFACRVGKGTHKALDLCHAWLRTHRYAFHGDIVKYFPSIDHQILRGLLARRIADPQTMRLIDHILDSGRLDRERAKGTKSTKGSGAPFVCFAPFRDLRDPNDLLFH